MIEVDLAIRKLPIEISAFNKALSVSSKACSFYSKAIILSPTITVEKIEVISDNLTVTTYENIQEEQEIVIGLEIAQVFTEVVESFATTIDMTIVNRYVALREDLFALNCSSNGFYYLTSRPYPIEVYEEVQGGIVDLVTGGIKPDYEGTQGSQVTLVAGLLFSGHKAIESTQGSQVTLVAGKMQGTTKNTESTQGSQVTLIAGKLQEIIKNTESTQGSTVTLISGDLKYAYNYGENTQGSQVTLIEGTLI